MSAYNDIETNEFFSECWVKMKARLAEYDLQKEPLAKQAEQQKKIIADEEARLLAQKTTNAWKRKGAPVVTQKESVSVTEAKLALGEIEKKLQALDLSSAKLKAEADELNTIVGDNEEFGIWLEQMRLPLNQRSMHKPALLVKFEKREADDLVDSLAKTEDWARLTLDHRSAEGTANRDLFYKRFYGVPEPAVEVQELVFVEEPVVEEDLSYRRKKLPWWYAKYNIPNDA